MAQNPWAVESIQEFYFLKCPECDFDTKEENSFENHATENHPLSLVLFDKQSVKKDFDAIKIKQEPLSHFDTQISHDSKKASVDNQLSPLRSVTDENSMPIVHDLKNLKNEAAEELYIDENELGDYEIEMNNSNTIEIYSADVEEDPLESNMMPVNEETKQSNLIKQIKSVHERIIYNCNICNYKSAYKYNLKIHIENVHEGIKPFKCSICESTFSQKGDMMKHIESVHEGIKPFKCNICNFETSINYNLKKHKESVHEGLKPFKCKLCDYKTARNFHLKLHINSVHEKIKPFKCFRCDSSFSQKGDMKRHVESVHERIKPFKCKICDFRSAKKCNLKKHIESVHVQNL